jgi:hypothetical protein
VKYLKIATLNNLTLKNGGSKQTLELYRRASEMYDEKVKECKKVTLFYLILIVNSFLLVKSQGDKSAGKMKMAKDPLFEKIVDQVQIE